MTIKELQSKTTGELQKDLLALRTQQRDLRFKAASQELKNTSEIGVVRKNIAQIMTLLGQRLATETPAEAVAKDAK